MFLTEEDHLVMAITALHKVVLFHRMILARILAVTGLFISQVPGLGQMPDLSGNIIQDTIYRQSIRTVMLRNISWELSPPVIELYTDQQLELLFDDLSDEQGDYRYALVHCNSIWRPSDVPWQQYLQGFNEGEIREVSRSFGTTRDYVNYRLVFPENNMVPVESGNYAIVVYERNRPDQIVLIRRFYVVERQVGIESQVNLTTTGRYNESGQQVSFTLTDPEGLVKDPHTELNVVVVQNGRPDRSMHAQDPRFISAGRFDYSFPDRFIFQGGDEFRSFDIKSMKYQSERIAEIDFRNPYYHVWLKPDESREFSPYFFKEDLDGAYFIDRENAVNKHQEADYVYVHFRLEPGVPAGDEQVYVIGRLSGWNLNESNRMIFNDQGHYELTLLLKQGLYDYMYVAVSAGMSPNDILYEGSHYETENDYSIFVYYHNMRDRLDNLIGFTSLKSP